MNAGTARDIPLLARILTITDVYDNLLNSPYKKHEYDKKGLKKELSRSRGTQLDPDMTDIFISMLGL